MKQRTNHKKTSGWKGKLIGSLIGSQFVRQKVIQKVHKTMWRNLVEINAGGFPRQLQLDKIHMGDALFDSIHRNVNRGLISKSWLKRLTGLNIDNLMIRSSIIGDFRSRHGFKPPLFAVISPTQTCNLLCQGCYACSAASKQASLSWETFDRILTEKQQLLGSYFTVISGGEPLVWKGESGDLLDMAEKHHDHLFMFYTNGTLIDEKKARRMAELGNITPAISVDGYEAETDARRGQGVFKKILAAMENLRRAGVPFGVSITALSHNWDLVSSEAFLDYFFDRQGATYGWIFQYMPIGERGSFDLVVSPSERLEMFQRLWHVVKEKKYFLADFWNGATVTSGCIAGGRPDGYFHINWHGDVSPCVFIPYGETNINEIYARGGNLEDALLSPFMKRIRQWQAEHGFTLYQSEHKNPDWEKLNLIAPCYIRDHYQELLQTSRDLSLNPLDGEAEKSISNPVYHRQMIEYGQKYHDLSARIWKDKYLEQSPPSDPQPQVTEKKH